MIQSDTFGLAKRMAQAPMGIGGKNAFIYWADIKRQWESAYPNAKIVDLIGSQSISEYCLPDVFRWLGVLTQDEKSFSEKFRNLYAAIAKFITTVDAPVSCETDLAETLLDMRILKKHIKFPVKVLDIGPGAGRNLLGICLSPEARGGVYVGIESIGLPYVLQNLVASYLWVNNHVKKFFDHSDYKFKRVDFPAIKNLPDNSIAHLPLWEDSLLPDNYFDVIICNYVLDEVPAHDFQRIADILGRCLAKDGIVYCRGSQQRSLLRDLYLYGYGTYHGMDITKTLTSKGLKVTDCELIASQMTRIFSREGSSEHSKTESKYNQFAEDLPLAQAMQNDFLDAELKQLVAAKKKVLVWGDNSQYEHFSKYVRPYADQLNIVGLTNRYLTSQTVLAAQLFSNFDLTQYPPEEIPSLAADVVIIASMRDQSIVRQLRKMFPPEEFKLVRKFNYPIAIAYRNV